MAERGEGRGLWVPVETMEEWRLKQGREAMHALLKAEMKRAAEEMERQVNTALFGAGMSRPELSLRVEPTRWERMWLWLWPVRRYLQTVWWAVRGDALEHERDEEDY